jgi:hypothetical protein
MRLAQFVARRKGVHGKVWRAPMSYDLIEYAEAVILLVCYSEAASRRNPWLVARKAKFFASAPLRLSMTSLSFVAKNHRIHLLQELRPWQLL